MPPPGALDGFFPGLKPRGHEDVLGLTARDLLAALPRRVERRVERVLVDDHELPVEEDTEIVRAYLRGRL